MKVKQNDDTFIRSINGMGYVTNQKTGKALLVSDTGDDFLKELSRELQDVKDVVSRLSNLYGSSVSYGELYSDYIAFLRSLQKDGFIYVSIDPGDEDCSNLVDSINSYNEGIIANSDKNTIRSFLLGSKPSYLHTLHLELTSRCNERCIHCYIPNEIKGSGTDFPKEKLLSLIDEFHQMGGLQITLSGGEALLYKDIEEVLRHCRKNDLQIVLFSNLTSLTDKQINVLKEVNIKMVQVSLYGMSSLTHDKITQKTNSFYKTKEAIEKLRRNEIQVEIACPTMKENYHEYKDVITYGKSIGCIVKTDNLLMAQSNFDNQNLSHRLASSDTEKLLNDMLEYDTDFREQFQNQANRNTKSDTQMNDLPICGAAADSCCISSKGDVTPCSGWDRYVCGNVFNQSLSEIWDNSEKLNNVRNVRYSDFQDCLKCEARNYCSLCLVRNYNESKGDMLKINPLYCEVAFLTKNIFETYLKNKNVEAEKRE